MSKQLGKPGLKPRNGHLTKKHDRGPQMRTVATGLSAGLSVHDQSPFFGRTMRDIYKTPLAAVTENLDHHNQPYTKYPKRASLAAKYQLMHRTGSKGFGSSSTAAVRLVSTEVICAATWKHNCNSTCRHIQTCSSVYIIYIHLYIHVYYTY